jgi:hypothetical protein
MFVGIILERTDLLRLQFAASRASVMATLESAHVGVRSATEAAETLLSRPMRDATLRLAHYREREAALGRAQDALLADHSPVGRALILRVAAERLDMLAYHREQDEPLERFVLSEARAIGPDLAPHRRQEVMAALSHYAAAMGRAETAGERLELLPARDVAGDPEYSFRVNALRLGGGAPLLKASEMLERGLVPQRAPGMSHRADLARETARTDLYAGYVGLESVIISALPGCHRRTLYVTAVTLTDYALEMGELDKALGWYAFALAFAGAGAPTGGDPRKSYDGIQRTLRSPAGRPDFRRALRRLMRDVAGRVPLPASPRA